jgi:hypothetical protein
MVRHLVPGEDRGVIDGADMIHAPQSWPRFPLRFAYRTMPVVSMKRTKVAMEAENFERYASRSSLLSVMQRLQY